MPTFLVCRKRPLRFTMQITALPFPYPWLFPKLIGPHTVFCQVLLTYVPQYLCGSRIS